MNWSFAFLNREPKSRIAILSHDPSIVGEGALLGDRATMINSQDDRVFMRSIATRGQSRRAFGGDRDCLAASGEVGFDLVLIETVGIGQEAVPFQRELVDQTIMVMSPDYGARFSSRKSPCSMRPISWWSTSPTWPATTASAKSSSGWS